MAVYYINSAAQGFLLPSLIIRMYRLGKVALIIYVIFLLCGQPMVVHEMVHDPCAMFSIPSRGPGKKVPFNHGESVFHDSQCLGEKKVSCGFSASWKSAILLIYTRMKPAFPEDEHYCSAFSMGTLEGSQISQLILAHKSTYLGTLRVGREVRDKAATRSR